MKHAEKKDILTRAISTGVLTNSVFFFFSFLCFFKFCIFAENTIKKQGFQPPPPPKKKRKKKHKKNPCVKNWSKLVSKTRPSMLRNIFGPIFNTRIVFFCFFSCLFCSSSFCREKEIFKKKQKWTSFNTGKGKNWTSFNSTAHIYIYIYICWRTGQVSR